MAAVIPYRLLHFDQEVYGEDVQSFRPERFMGSAGEKLTRGDSWRPFGGGKTMCSGRHVAKRATRELFRHIPEKKNTTDLTVVMFLAMILKRFDITIVGDDKMPPADLGRPVLGIMAVKLDEDYTVRLTERLVPGQTETRAASDIMQ
jgi:hypothetical protein